MDFEFGTIQWEHAVIPMKSIDCTQKDMYVQDAQSIAEETSQVKSILDAKYEAADLNQIVNKCDHLSKTESTTAVTPQKV